MLWYPVIFTGSLQGRITTQGDPCNLHREGVCSVLKNCQHGGRGCQRSGKIADFVYGWSLSYTNKLYFKMIAIKWKTDWNYHYQQFILFQKWHSGMVVSTVGPVLSSPHIYGSFGGPSSCWFFLSLFIFHPRFLQQNISWLTDKK